MHGAHRLVDHHRFGRSSSIFSFLFIIAACALGMGTH